MNMFGKSLIFLNHIVVGAMLGTYLWVDYRKYYYRMKGRADNGAKKDSFPATYSGELKQASCIIKLGGSACTVKQTFETYNHENVQKFSEQLSEICNGDSSYKPIVIHGAGSFGHFQAKSYSVNDGAISETGKPSSPSDFISSFLREGFIKTRISVTGLNHRVVSSMANSGIPVVGVSPFPYIPVKYRKLNYYSDTADPIRLNTGDPLDWKWDESFNMSISGSLTMGLVPVLHGDACIDITEKVTGILSGDTLFTYLCHHFRPTHAVFITDVDGVFTSPPSNPGSELIMEILIDHSGKLKISTSTGSSVYSSFDDMQHKRAPTSSVSTDISSSKAPELVTSVASHDVTGGIDGKLKSAYDACRKHKIPIYIVKVGTPDALCAMKGQSPKNGTTIRYEDNI